VLTAICLARQVKTMADKEEQNQDTEVEDEGSEDGSLTEEVETEEEDSEETKSTTEDEEGVSAASVLGSARYVMAGFFIAGIVAAFIVGRLLNTIWGAFVEALWFQKSMGFLARIGEETRGEYCTVIGGVIALILAVYAYRRPDIRQWTDEVASELSKVTWPDKAEVTNSTIIVIVTSGIATIYLALLDRFWGFVTNLVYNG
jgi:preprotein translocase subunit SecE